VVACDPAYAPAADLAFVESVGLGELAARADVISLHCALTERTRGMIDRDLLRHAKPGAILVNVARGAIVDSDDLLLEALDNGWLSAVALDVFAAEPPNPRHPLLLHRRCVCTPHSVALTRRWSEGVFASLADGVASLLRGERPVHIVNPAALEQASATAGQDIPASR
jgi:phosphoglycerate dehydrogenase-like enzyme